MENEEKQSLEGSTPGFFPVEFLVKLIVMLHLKPERLSAQVVRSDSALYIGSKLKLEQEEGLTGVLTGVSDLPFVE